MSKNMLVTLYNISSARASKVLQSKKSQKSVQPTKISEKR